MTVISRHSLATQWIERMDEVEAGEWNALACDDVPFLSWEWLHLLETSGAVGQQTGWMPFHLTLRHGGRLVGAAPMYIKAHSNGEFVFDQIWAEAATRFGVRYYPKLVGMSPFTPVTGYRFLLDRTLPDQAGLTAAMFRSVGALMHGAGLSGVSFLFADPGFAAEARDNGYHLWEHQTFAWENPGYVDFDAYLARFNSNRRRSVRRERQELRDQGIAVRFVGRDEFTTDLLRDVYTLYKATNAKFGVYGCKFLLREFFDGLLGPAGADVLLALAERPGEENILGMALYVRKGDSLWGRYWGARCDIRFLHFELCMYAPIEWAIAHGIRMYDPGMGGKHKAVRGFVSGPGASLHHFAHPAMEMLFVRNMDNINDLERAYMEEMNSLLPYRSGE